MSSSPQAVPVPVGLIGLGKHGARYLHHIRADVPGLRLVAVSRRDAGLGRAQARELGVRFHREPSDLVADPEVRAVVAVVPPTLHPEIAAACARRRRPLLLEKPVAVDAATAFRIGEEMAATGTPCLVGHTLRYSAVVAAVRSWSEGLGRVSQILLTQSFEPTRLDWLDDPERAGGGNVLHTGVHMFDLLRFLSGGEVEEASCLVERVETARSEDSFAASFRLRGREGPLLGSAAGSRATRGRAGQIRVVGAHGQIVADHVHGTVALLEGREVVRSMQAPDVPTVRALLEEFAEVATGRRPPSITAEDGARAVAIAQACYRSSATGRHVRLAESEDVPWRYS